MICNFYFFSLSFFDFLESISYGFSFELQKAVPYRKLSVSLGYYKRNIYVYNLGFHNFCKDNVKVYVWDETTSSRGAQEVA